VEEARKKGLTPDSITYHLAIVAWTKAGNTERAAHWLGEARKTGLAPDSTAEPKAEIMEEGGLEAEACKEYLQA